MVWIVPMMEHPHFLLAGHFLVVQRAPADGPTGSAPALEILTLIAVGALFVAVTLVVIGLLRARATGDGDDDSGPGRGGPQPPSGDPGPSGANPTWWPEFERDFAAYLEATARRRTDRAGLSRVDQQGRQGAGSAAAIAAATGPESA
jgi:hypothetical protein